MHCEAGEHYQAAAAAAAELEQFGPATRMRVSGSSAGAAAAAAAAGFAVLPDETRRTTRAAAKRAAVDEGSRAACCSVTAGHHQQPKKRAALADLSKQINIPAAQVLAVAKSSVTRVVKPRSVAIEESSEEIESKENVLQGETASIAFRKCPSQDNPRPSSSSATIASLERRTLQSLYISKNAKPGNSSDVSMEEGIGWSEKLLSFVDIDTENKDPQMCSVYVSEIYQHHRIAELKRRPSINFMSTVQQDINPSMRGILVDWLVEVAEEYKLVPDTLYLTINYIDRYLSSNVVNRQKLQLLGVSCMLIASKYEEICAPQVEEFCYITDNTYNREELLEMERKVLNHLKFELTTPTAKSFLRRFLRAAHGSCKAMTLQLDFLGNYLTELTLVEYSFLKYLPSLLAASAVFLAKLTLDTTARPWDSTMHHYTGYSSSQLKDCVIAIHDLQLNKKNCTLPAIREKYRQHKFKCVASLIPPATIPPEYLDGRD